MNVEIPITLHDDVFDWTQIVTAPIERLVSDLKARTGLFAHEARVSGGSVWFVRARG